MTKNILTFLFIIYFFSFLNAQNNSLKREHRGVWMATVGNIDWPSDRNSSSGQKIKELVEDFDSFQQAGVNAVFFQVRTECDALYDSPYETWSYWLTGEQGVAPEPYFDPLGFAVSEAHQRGMELHAWFNPYRVTADSGAYRRHSSHISKTHPEWILRFGKYSMLDPGNPQVKNYIIKVVTDVISRYDIDGIHFDDYFYPYSPKVSNEDSVTFTKHSEGIADIDDWRRFSVNDLMRKLYEVIKAVKPKVKFGISPFGVVENKYTNSNAFESYHKIYCDPLNWLDNQIVDYITPQIYWERGFDKADYSKLLPWWTTVLNDRHLYVGQYSGRFLSNRFKGDKSEIYEQIKLNRNTTNCGGQVFFSAKSLINNTSGFLDSLKNDYYKFIAFPPLMPWKDSIPPLPPQDVRLEADKDFIKIFWQDGGVASDGDPVNFYVLYAFVDDEEICLDKNQNVMKIISGRKKTFKIKTTDIKKEFVKVKFILTSLDKLYNESIPSDTVIYQKE